MQYVWCICLTAAVKQRTVSDLIFFFCISPAALSTLFTDATAMSPTTEVPIVLIASALSGIVGVVVVVLIVAICLIALWKKRQVVKEKESGKYILLISLSKSHSE